MKKLLCICLAIIMMFAFSSCGSSDETTTTAEATTSDIEAQLGIEVDVDLTALSATMVYSEVYNMVTNPEDYYGLIVKMVGIFSVYEDSTTGQMYFAILITDATACCSQGIEFLLVDGEYPDDYPELYSTATVIGEFESYEENGYTYYRLKDAYLA